MGQERVAPWYRHIFSPILLLKTRLPAPCHCNPTPPFQAISHLIKRLSLTPESSVCHSQTLQLSLFNIGSPQGPSSRHSHNIARRGATTSFILLIFVQNQRWHAYIQTNPSQTRYLHDTPRRLLPLSLTLLALCQHFQHQQPLQSIILCQTRMLNPWQRSLRWCNKYFSRTPQRWHTFTHVCLPRGPHIHWLLHNTNHTPPPFQNGTGRHCQPLYYLHKLRRTRPNPSTPASTTGRKKHKQASISASQSAPTCLHRSLDQYPRCSSMTHIFVSDGFAMLSHLLTHLNPSSNKNIFIEISDLTRL